jgi:hypothetical protein
MLRWRRTIERAKLRLVRHRLSFVMAGLDPAIHDETPRIQR